MTALDIVILLAFTGVIFWCADRATDGHDDFDEFD
jgi:hypothetical protein